MTQGDGGEETAMGKSVKHAVPDDENPQWMDEDFARARPAGGVLPPKVVAALAKRRPGVRGPQKAPTKIAVTLRLDRDVVDSFKAGGPGWQTRINETLRKAVGR